MGLFAGRPGRGADFGDVRPVGGSHPEPDQRGRDLRVGVQCPMYHPDRLCVDVSRRVVLQSALVLKRHQAAQHDEIDDAVVNMPRGCATRVELGELDIHASFRISRETGLDLIEEDLANMRAVARYEPGHYEGEGGWIDRMRGHAQLSHARLQHCN